MRIIHGADSGFRELGFHGYICRKLTKKSSEMPHIS